MDYVVSINTLTYEGYPLATALKEISRIGAKYVELGFTLGFMSELTEDLLSERNAQKMSRYLSSLGLSSVAFAAHIDLTVERAVDDFMKRMNYAKQIGASIIHTKVGPRSRRNEFMKSIEILAPAAASMDLTIGLENPAEGEDQIIDSGGVGAQVIREIGSEVVRLNYDFGNTLSYSRGNIRPEEDFKAALPFAAHLHFKDFGKDDNGWAFSPIGTGAIDYEAVLEYLVAQDRLLPTAIELPVIYDVHDDLTLSRSDKVMPLSDINEIVKTSLDFVEATVLKYTGNP